MISLLAMAMLAAAPLDEARDAYQSGRLQASQQTLETLLYPLQLDDAELEREARFLLAASLFAQGDRNRAEEEAIRAWGTAETTELDPLLFPPDFVAFASEVRARHAARIAALTADRSVAPASKLDAPVSLTTKPVDLPATPAVQARSPALSFVPFGAPQFRRGDRVQGTFLATGQGVCLLSAVGGLSGALSLRGPDGLYSKEDAEVAHLLNAAWVTGAWCFLGLYGYGVVEDLVSR